MEALSLEELMIESLGKWTGYQDVAGFKWLGVKGLVVLPIAQGWGVSERSRRHC